MRARRLWLKGRGLCVAGLFGLALLLLVQVAHWYRQATWRWHTELAGLPLTLPVTGALRFASTPLGGHLLNGRHLQTRYGLVEFQWRAAERQLLLRCAPCRIDTPGFSERALDMASIQLSLQRSGDRLWGQIESGSVRAYWWAVLSENHLALAGALPDTPLAAVYALFAAAIPESAMAKIDGDVAVQVDVQLPSGGSRIDVHTQGLRVAGLGTERLRGVASSVIRQPTHADTIDADSMDEGDAKLTTGPGRHYLRCAVIAAEDQNFFEHAGYDTQAITASFTANVDHGGILLGASTLTQQLAKLLFVGDERNHLRKLRELLYAVEMERTLGKAQILDLYLATAPWGENQFGADAAARHYFGKHTETLNLAEAAWLASMLRNPARAIDDPATHIQRSLWVVDGMRRISHRQRHHAQRELRQWQKII
jgi:monofunctional glycosyltransferase